MKKNILSIFLILVFLIFSTFAVSFTAFKMYFGNSRIQKRTKHMVQMLFQRQSSLQYASFNILGRCYFSRFKMSNKGGFDNGTMFEVFSVKAGLNMFKIFKKQLEFKYIDIEKPSLKLNYKFKRNIDIGRFFSNADLVFLNSDKRHGYIADLKSGRVAVKNGNIKILSDEGEYELSEINAFIENYGYRENFAVSGSFILKYKSIMQKFDFKVEYISSESKLSIIDIRSEKIIFSGFFLFDNGLLVPNLNVDIEKNYFFDTISDMSVIAGMYKNTELILSLYKED